MTKVYPLQYAIAEELAKTLNEVLGGAMQRELPKGFKTTWLEAGAEQTVEAMKTVSFKGKTFVVPEQRTNSLIVTTDTPANFIMLEMLIKKLDTPTLQVLIETQIAEVKLTDQFKFGISWVWRDLHTGENVGGSHASTRPASTIHGTMRYDALGETFAEGYVPSETDIRSDDIPLYFSEGGPYKFLITNRNVAALLQMTKTLSDIDIVSNPKIVTANHIKGHIFIGEKVPIIEGRGSGQWTWRWEEVGVTLDVTPHINEQGETTLEVKTHASELGEYRTIWNVPSIITRTVETKAMVPNGQTLVIGGMMRNKVTEGRSGIPGLMRIPVLKYLFSTKTKEKEKVEYIFLLTPHIIMAGREIRPEEVPEIREAVSAPLESSLTPEVIKTEPKEKKKNNKQRKKN